MELLTFTWLCVSVFILWFAGSIFLLMPGHRTSLKRSGLFFIWAGIMGIAGYIGILWLDLERPPMRTLGETRLWYAFFLSLTGIILYSRWKLAPLLYYGIFLSAVFLIIDLKNPEILDQDLMPALQSPWFVPHVIVYMIAYAVLGMSMFFGLLGLYRIYRKKEHNDLLLKADNIVYIGFSFLTLGLVFGALWAKEAWGQYWTWDPKEIWAFITWICYLLYIHLRIARPKSTLLPMLLLAAMFFILLICWFGVNYLPSAQNSVHIYQ